MLINVTVRDNEAVEGAGIYNMGSDPVLVNVTVRDNEAHEDGAGIYNMGSDPVMINMKIQGNVCSCSWRGPVQRSALSPANDECFNQWEPS